MTLRALLRILLLVALVPLVLRTRDQRERDALDDGLGDDGLDDMDEALNLASASGEVEEEDDFDDELLVDINSAPRAALLALPGIDDDHADLILEHRPFRSKHDLLRLGYVADDIYREIRDHIVARQGTGAGGRA